MHPMRLRKLTVTQASLFGGVVLLAMPLSALAPLPRLDDVLPPNDAQVSANTKVWAIGANLASEGTAAVCDEATDGDTESCTGERLPTFQDSFCRSQSISDAFSSTQLPSVAVEGPLRISVDLQTNDGPPNTIFRDYSVVAVDDVSPPTAPRDVRVDLETPHFDGGGGSGRPTIRARWSAASDDFGIAYYRLERRIDGQPRPFGCVASRSGATEYSFFDVREPGEVFEFQVRAIDFSGNEGAASRAFIAATPGSMCSCVGVRSEHSFALLLSLFFLLRPMPRRALSGVSDVLRRRSFRSLRTEGHSHTG